MTVRPMQSKTKITVRIILKISIQVTPPNQLLFIVSYGFWDFNSFSLKTLTTELLSGMIYRNGLCCFMKPITFKGWST